MRWLPRVLRWAGAGLRIGRAIADAASDVDADVSLEQIESIARKEPERLVRWMRARAQMLSEQGES